MSKRLVAASVRARLPFILGSLIMTIFCTQVTSSEATTPSEYKDYQSYSKDGLRLQHPSHWSLAYDDNDALYSDRAVAFNISEGNIVSVFIYNKLGQKNSNIADRYTHVIEPGSSKYVEEFSRSPITIEGYKGEKLRWTNTMLFPYTTEISILQVIQSPTPVFVVFELLEEDVEKVIPHILPVLDSIKFQL